MRKPLYIATAISLLLPSIPSFANDASAVIYPAKSIITMEDSNPLATAVAVREGKIISVGELTQVKAALGEQAYTIDNHFAGKVIMPGFVEPHVHMWLFALIGPSHFVTPADWQLPNNFSKGIIGQENYLTRLTEIEQKLDDEEWLISWGYHQNFHGELSRELLDKISPERPILIWHRSAHEFYLNTAALKKMSITEESLKDHGEASNMLNYEKGHFWEKGIELIISPLFQVLAAPDRFKEGLEMAKAVTHLGGITTAADQGVQLNEQMMEPVYDVFDTEKTPFDYYLIPEGRSIVQQFGTEKALEETTRRTERQGTRVKWLDKQVKLFTDGAAFSQLMQLEDGYLDGHHGEWIATPEEFNTAASLYWKDGYQISVHANGDLGVKTALDSLERLSAEQPRYDHRFALHHFMISKAEQAKRAGQLGAIVSANPFYLYVLGENYGEVGVGKERAHSMVRNKSVLDNHVKLSFHSDSPMAPMNPLLLAWNAVNRVGLQGKVMAPEERITVEQAMRAITIDAAHAIRMEQEIGSIAAGKHANFTILEQSPYEVEPMALKDIKIWGTVYQGMLAPIQYSENDLTALSSNGLPPQQINVFVSQNAGKDQQSGHSHTHGHGDSCEVNHLFQKHASQL